MQQESPEPETASVVQLERRQDEVLRQLEALDTSITALIEEFHRRLLTPDASRSSLDA